MMSYSVHKPMLQKALGIPHARPEEILINEYEERVNLVNEINNKMMNIRYLTEKSSSHFCYYMNILKLFNKDTHQTKLPPYQENPYKKAGRITLFSLNFAFCVAGSYFASTLFLTIVAASLLGTPAGWAIIGGLILATIASKLLIRRNYVFSLLNPIAIHHDTVREKLANFEDKSEELDHTLSMLRKIEKADEIEKLHKLNKRQELMTKKIFKPHTKSFECPAFFKPGESLSNQIIQDVHSAKYQHAI